MHTLEHQKPLPKDTFHAAGSLPRPERDRSMGGAGGDRLIGSLFQLGLGLLAVLLRVPLKLELVLLLAAQIGELGPHREQLLLDLEDL